LTRNNAVWGIFVRGLLSKAMIVRGVIVLQPNTRLWVTITE